MTTRTARAKLAAGIHDPRYPAHIRLTPDELHARAVQRRDRDLEMFRGLALTGVSRHELVRIFDRRAPHANRSTAERRHSDRRPARLRAKLAYAKGLLNNAKGLHANGKAMPWFYQLSARNQEAAPLALAA